MEREAQVEAKAEKISKERRLTLNSGSVTVSSYGNRGTPQVRNSSTERSNRKKHDDEAVLTVEGCSEASGSTYNLRTRVSTGLWGDEKEVEGRYGELCFPV
jgi:hypothetical protein